MKKKPTYILSPALLKSEIMNKRLVQYSVYESSEFYKNTSHSNIPGCWESVRYWASSNTYRLESATHGRRAPSLTITEHGASKAYTITGSLHTLTAKYFECLPFAFACYENPAATGDSIYRPGRVPDSPAYSVRMVWLKDGCSALQSKEPANHEYAHCSDRISKFDTNFRFTGSFTVNQGNIGFVDHNAELHSNRLGLVASFTDPRTVLNALRAEHKYDRDFLVKRCKPLLSALGAMSEFAKKKNGVKIYAHSSCPGGVAKSGAEESAYHFWLVDTRLPNKVNVLKCQLYDRNCGVPEVACFVESLRPDGQIHADYLPGHLDGTYRVENTSEWIPKALNWMEETSVMGELPLV